MPPCIVEEEVCFVFLFNIFFTYVHCYFVFLVLDLCVMKLKYIFSCPSYISTTWHTNNFPFYTTNTGMRKSFLKGNAYTIAE